ncbi:MAG TPA: hypothetical protein VNR59_00605 [Gaiellaceae bacterium]|nr:hypothetical protein [Gaiellaceae bacterium]
MGNAVVSGGCAVERVGLGLELERNPQLAHWLLKMRTALEDAGGDRLLHELVPPELRQ